MAPVSPYPSFDPKAPTTPASLQAIGLVSDCPYIDEQNTASAEGFAGVVSSIISRKLQLNDVIEKELTAQLVIERCPYRK